MIRKVFAAALAALVLSAVAPAAHAQDEPAPPAPTVPETVQITDPSGDANYLNDQGLGAALGQPFGDNTTPADAGSVSDILKVWFVNDADTVTAYVQTEAPPPASASAYIFRVQVDPGAGSNCLWFQIVNEGPTNPGDPYGSLRNTCDGDDTVTDGVTANFWELEDGTGISAVTVPRTADASLVDGAVLGNPIATARNFLGGVATAPQIDDTKPGTAYTITAPPKPPAPHGKKKGCSKGSPKAKKYGCKK
ncbi:MAG TPA: hypothetical protein VFK89_04330 [Actinomycetota bacterium]|nr:hypothetical protein [Actinomycetota bacterium]